METQWRRRGEGKEKQDNMEGSMISEKDKEMGKKQEEKMKTEIELEAQSQRERVEAE